MSIGNTLNGIGRYTTMSSTITGLMTAMVCCISLGYAIHSKNTSHFVKTRAAVSNPVCDSYKEEVCQKTNNRDTCRMETRHRCTHNVTFLTQNGDTITTQMKADNKVFDGEKLQIEYNRHNPFKVRKPIPYDIIITGLGIGVCCVIAATATTAAFSRSRTFRQYHATSTGLSMLSNAIARN